MDVLRPCARQITSVYCIRYGAQPSSDARLVSFKMTIKNGTSCTHDQYDNANTLDLV